MRQPLAHLQGLTVINSDTQLLPALESCRLAPTPDWWKHQHKAHSHVSLLVLGRSARIGSFGYGCMQSLPPKNAPLRFQRRSHKKKSAQGRLGNCCTEGLLSTKAPAAMATGMATPSTTTATADEGGQRQGGHAGLTLHAGILSGLLGRIQRILCTLARPAHARLQRLRHLANAALRAARRI